MTVAAAAEEWEAALAARQAEEAEHVAAAAAAVLDVDLPPPEALDPLLLAKADELVSMGFDRARAMEMLDLSGGDVEAAVALLCS